MSYDLDFDEPARAEDYEEPYDIGTCQGCGAYGVHGRMHVRNGEECGEYL